MHPPKDPFGEPVCVKFLAVQRWAGRRLGGTDHERRVAAVAASIFDLTRPLHGLAQADCRLLRLAALVHDVGRCLSRAEHPTEGAWLIMSDTTLPLTPAERRGLAYLTLYHRGKVPPPGRDAVLEKCDDHARLRLLLALLRAGDALDSRSLETPRLVFALTNPPADARPARRARDAASVPCPPCLRVTCYLGRECAEARRSYGRRKKFRLLEELLGVRVEIEITRADALRLVA